MADDKLTRRHFGIVFGASRLAARGGGRLTAGETKTEPTGPEGLQWHDVRRWGVEGRGWSQTERYFDRLPAKAKGIVRNPVWSGRWRTAGMAVRFATDWREISVRYELIAPEIAFPHMSATGVSGVDLYGQDAQGRWQWLWVSQPTGTKVEGRFAAGIEPGRREYLLYFPLYNGVLSLEIGVPTATRFEPLAPRSVRPLVFYGTSITQGCSASRPGMAYPAILGRRLGLPAINLGFAGHGRMDLEMGELLDELDAAAYVVDCCPNTDLAGVNARAEPLVRILRKARPAAPILLVGERVHTNAALIPNDRERHEAKRRALVAAYERLKASGVANLHYLDGEHLVGEDGEAAVDGSHPSDLGMMRIAESLEPVLNRVLTPR